LSIDGEAGEQAPQTSFGQADVWNSLQHFELSSRQLGACFSKAVHCYLDLFRR
jgi:hypothetical protein